MKGWWPRAHEKYWWQCGGRQTQRGRLWGVGGVLHMSLLIVCVCVFAFACLSVCLFDISVTYRAAVSL